MEEAIEVNNSVVFGLSSAIFSRDVNRIFRAQRDLDTGIVYVNAGTTGAEIHFRSAERKGLVTDTGIQELLRSTFYRVESIYVDYSGTLQRAQIDNS